MFKFLFKKESLLESSIYEYLDALIEAQENFLLALQVCYENQHCEQFDFLTEQTHKLESKADDIRENIKSMMYSKALIPDSRGDIMGLLEAIDEIPHLFEVVLYMLQLQKITIPEFILPDFKEIIRLSLECCNLLYRQVRIFFERSGTIRDLVSKIDLNESHCDHIERGIIRDIFDSQLDPFQKLQLKELVLKIGDIADQAESVSRRVNIINMKRRV